MIQVSDKIRAFLSINITDDILLQKISKVQNSLDRSSAKMKLVEPENIHFTLRFLGDTSLAKLEALEKEVEKVSFDSFDIMIETVGTFPKISKPRVVWVGVIHNATKFIELKRMIDSGFARQGYRKDRRFTPHATIARIRSIKDRKRLKENLMFLADTKIGKMEIKRVSMMSSTLTPKGAIYKELWSINARNR
ncbi:MAG: RNA 2',3'-cyclic phosphodiesterase [Candidatus Thorarchaeota archaeon]|nr:MAG: RNA 2',3'-cyclic phosphodiesterase [Candidatus Thorarchaeota archaeon]